MAVARCSHCDMNYPKDIDPCPMCEKPTWVDKSEDADWDGDWRATVESFHKRHIEGNPIPNADIPVVTKGDRYFVAASLLKESGYWHVHEDSVLLIRGKFYEVEGMIYRNSDTPSWWIEPVSVSTKDIPVMSDTEYADLEERRGIRPW